MKINTSCYRVKQADIAGTRLIIMLVVMLAVGLFHTDAYSRSSDSQQMDRMKVQFNSAITAGDVNKAKEIWGSIDSQFSDNHFNKMTARTVIFGGGALFRREQLQQLYATNSAQFKAIALFISGIDPYFDKQARSGNAYAYAFSQKVRITLKANHRHENSWKLTKKIMAANR